ncbi:MAG: adenine phosphoribosyltransferase [Oscillospiraceae bacterium]|nr:adenine phosphoribosyltransferase [Oscillospiraceae bacterium]MBR1898702.1 adenine phosphoribosyltransferase [Oscillospiraceae bacterium]
MAEFYEMKIAGLDRKLKKCAVSDKLDIAAFIMFSDVEVTVESAKQLLAKCPEFDVIITAESKGIPLAYEMARQSGKNYVVARKSVKLYMTDVVSVKVKSITTANEQVLHLDGEKAALLKGKRVLIVDDVISTGESLKALESLVEQAGGTIAAEAAVLAEGDAAERDDIIFLDPLPLFFKA